MRRWVLGTGILVSIVLFSVGLGGYLSSSREEDRSHGAQTVVKSVELAAKTLEVTVDVPPQALAPPAPEAPRALPQPSRIAPRTVRLDGELIELHPNAASGFADEAVHGLGSAAGAADDVAHGFGPVAGAADDVAHGFAPVAGVADDVGRGVGAAAGFADDAARGLAHAGPLKLLGSALKWIFAAVAGGAAAVFAIRRRGSPAL